MLNQHRKYGMVAPAITLLKKGYVDSDAVKALMQFLKKSGAKGVFIAGTTGNAPMLSLNDHKEVIKQYIKYAKDEHLTTFAGIGRDSIEETIDMGKYSIELGADKLVAVTPYYLKKDKKQMYEYYSELLKKLDSEVFIYNILKTVLKSYPFSMKNLDNRFFVFQSKVFLSEDFQFHAKSVEKTTRSGYTILKRVSIYVDFLSLFWPVISEFITASGPIPTIKFSLLFTIFAVSLSRPIPCAR
jgi:hypothetical protein